MTPLYEIKNAPEAKRLGKLLLLAVLLWLLGFALLSQSLYFIRSGRERLDEADSIMKAASIVRSYPSFNAAASREPLSDISYVIDYLKLKDRVGQMSSGQSGLLLSIDRLHPEEFTALVESITEKGLYIKTAEIRAMSSGKDGRLINVMFAIGVEE